VYTVEVSQIECTRHYSDPTYVQPSSPSRLDGPDVESATRVPPSTRSEVAKRTRRIRRLSISVKPAI
jgi:hypothetical protein